MVLQKLTLRSGNRRGFTLVELAIVLAVASLLFAGLWRLMSSGNTQLRDQSSADQQRQLITAVQTFLGSSGPTGQGYGSDFLSGMLTTVNGGGANTLVLSLPGAGGCTANTCAQFVNYLPTGFTSATTNSYGQIYNIVVMINTTGVIPTKTMTSYSFMILTSGGTTIPDTSGGRIASMIGNDGGFIYGTNVCNNQAGTMTTSDAACGAFGNWATTVSSYFAAAGISGASGHVASLSYPNSSASSLEPWLARQLMNGDSATSPTNIYNTMKTNMFFTPTAGLALDMEGNAINMQGGTIDGGVGGIPTSIIQNVDQVLIGNANQNLKLIVNGPSAVVGTGNPYAADCGTAGGGVGACKYIAAVNGNMYVSGMLAAAAFYAGSFVYDSDIRLKKNIKKLVSPLEKLSKLRAVSFTYIGGDKAGMGVIAQDVEKIYPELVSGIGDGYKGVDYVGFVGPLVGAVQELKMQNDQLREQLKEQAIAIKQLQKQRHQEE
jgi:prepilin-type N-terminal cleavage/methylation domain-containing protein